MHLMLEHESRIFLTTSACSFFSRLKNGSLGQDHDGREKWFLVRQAVAGGAAADVRLHVNGGEHLKKMKFSWFPAFVREGAHLRIWAD